MIAVNSSGQALSADYATTLAGDNRKFLSKLSVNGTELDGAIVNWTLTKGSCGGSQFEVGVVMSSTFTATLTNLTTNVKNEDIKVEIGLEINGAYEWITLGYFTATEVKKTHYQTDITAYGHCVSKTGDNLSMSTTQTLANVKNAISSATGVSVSMDGSIDGTLVIDKDLAGLTTYQVLQVLASVVGGYAMDEADGSISIYKYDNDPTLSVGTDRMVTLPDAEEVDFAVTGIQVTSGEDVYTSGTVNIEVNNEYITQDLFNDEIVDLIGYSYRPATIPLSKGDPRLEGNDVLNVTDIGGSTYLVPCHSVIHKYDGGLSSEIRSIRATMMDNLEATPAPISTKMKEQEKQIIRVDRIASNTNQYFWFTSTGTDTGAHITEVPQDEWLDSTNPNYHSGGNLLARSNGIAVRDGMTELATFGASGVVIGQNANGKSRSEITNSGMAILQKKNGNDVEIANLGYGSSKNPDGTLSDKPYFTLGSRYVGSDIGGYSLTTGAECEASGFGSISSGFESTASGNYSSAIGYRAIASGDEAFAEGIETRAIGDNSHAENSYSQAIGDNSHAEGYYTKASSDNQHAQGKYNVEDANNVYADIVGNGTADNARKNISALEWAGNLRLKGDVYVGCNDDSTGGSKLGTVTGVKGDAESTYRTGDVNLTPANVSAVALADKYTRSSAGGLDWVNQTDGDAKVIAKSALAFWDGTYNGSGSNLSKCADGTILGTNTVADYVIEKGVTSSWYYRKWHSGKVEAWRTQNMGSQTPSEWVTGWYYKDLNVTIPNGIFSATPNNVIATNKGSDYQFMVFSAVPTSATNITVRVVKPNSGSATPNLSLYVCNMT